jgi:hypothetical protein
MQTRTQSLLVQVCLALLCAVGAGMSGYMQVHATGHLSHHARHARGTHLRGTRPNGRDTQGDHAQEIDVAHDSGDREQQDNRPIPATILPQPPAFTMAWASFGLVPAPQVGFVQSVAQLHLPARAPPTFA